MIKGKKLLCIIVLAVLAYNCGPAKAKDNENEVFEQEGIASYYGKKFHGRKTASGERFDMHKLTAAHKTLPFGTMVEVTHIRNGKKVVVRINDRGPFKKGRIIDLSYAAAKKIGIIKSGLAQVRIRVVKQDDGN